MSYFVLNRNHTLRSLKGHIINFEKGQPTYVPPAVVREAVEIGAEPVEDMDKTNAVLGEEIKPPPPDLTADERKALMFEAFEELERTNVRKDFTGGGQPTVAAVTRVAGFEPDKREIEDAWLAYKMQKAE